MFVTKSKLKIYLNLARFSKNFRHPENFTLEFYHSQQTLDLFQWIPRIGWCARYCRLGFRETGPTFDPNNIPKTVLKQSVTLVRLIIIGFYTVLQGPIFDLGIFIF